MHKYSWLDPKIQGIHRAIDIEGRSKLHDQWGKCLIDQQFASLACSIVSKGKSKLN